MFRNLCACLVFFALAVLLTSLVVTRPWFTQPPDVLAPRGAVAEQYVGAAKCAECHRETSDQQARTHMAETLQTAEEYLSKHPLPLPAVVFDERNQLRYRVDYRDGRLGMEVERGREIAQAEMTYVLGSGKLGLTFVRELDTGDHEELRVSYFLQLGRWDLTPGQTSARPASVTEALGRPIEKRGDGCLDCHATLLVQSNDRIDLARSSFGVSCERCHGPGRDHVESAAHGTPAKLRPPELTEALRLAQRFREGERPQTPQDELLHSLASATDERLLRDLYVCGECHGRREIGSKRSDEQMAKFPVAGMVESACYQRSTAKLVCTDCHDPHGDSPRDDLDYVAVCLRCHGDRPSPTAGSETPEPRGDAADNIICPVKPHEGCIGCHMPPRSPIAHVHFTQHRIAMYRDGRRVRSDRATGGH